jgi:hypothetical protein
MSYNTNKLHSLIGGYLREIEKIKKSAKDNELSKVKIAKVNSLRKIIIETANKLQRGLGW